MNLSAQGFYKVPADRCGYNFDLETNNNRDRGFPFNYFTQVRSVKTFSFLMCSVGVLSIYYFSRYFLAAQRVKYRETLHRVARIVHRRHDSNETTHQSRTLFGACVPFSFPSGICALLAVDLRMVVSWVRSRALVHDHPDKHPDNGYIDQSQCDTAFAT